MKQVRIRFKEEYNEYPEELVVLIVPDNTTNKEIKEKLEKATYIMYGYNDNDEEYDISKEDVKIMEKAFKGCYEGTILDFTHAKYGWEYEYVTEEYDIDYVY